MSFCVSVSVNKGEFSVPLNQVTNLAPFAQVVVYTVMPSGEAVADSQDFPIQLCLNNKVQAQWPSRTFCHMKLQKLAFFWRTVKYENVYL